MELSSTIVKRVQCPECAKKGMDNSHDNLVVYDDGHSICFACGYKEGFHNMNDNGNSNKVKFPNYVLPCVDIEHRNIGEEVLQSYCVKELPVMQNSKVIKSGGMPIPSGNIVFPFFEDFGSRDLSALKFRDFYSEVNYHCPKKDSIRAKGTLTLFGMNTINFAQKEIIIWEGEIDTLYAAQYDDKRNHLGIPGTKFSKLIQKFNVHLRRFRKIYFALDADTAGSECLEQCLEYLPSYLCWIIDYSVVGVNDLSDIDPLNLSIAYRELIKSAYQRNVTQLFTGNSLLEVFRKNVADNNNIVIFPTQFPELNRLMGGGGLHLSEMCLFTANTGVGKSTFVSSLVHHWVTNKIAKVLWVGTESQAKKTLYKFAQHHYGRKYYIDEDGYPSISNEEIENYLESIQDDIVFYDDLLSDFEKLEEALLVSILTHDTDIIVIDVLNDIDPMFADPVRTKDIMKRLNRLAQGSRIDNIKPVSLILVAHTVKIDGRYSKYISTSAIAGGQPVTQKSTMILALEEDSEDFIRKIKVIKRSRDYGLDGEPSFQLMFDDQTSSYEQYDKRQEYQKHSRRTTSRFSTKFSRYV